MTFGCRIGVINLASGGFVGYFSPISTYSTKTLFSYGDPGGPCIQTFQNPMLLSLAETSMNSCSFSTISLTSCSKTRPVPEALTLGLLPPYCTLAAELLGREGGNEAGKLPEKRARMRRASPRLTKSSFSLGWGRWGRRSKAVSMSAGFGVVLFQFMIGRREIGGHI